MLRPQLSHPPHGCSYHSDKAADIASHVYHDSPLFRATLSFLEHNLAPTAVTPTVPIASAKTLRKRNTPSTPVPGAPTYLFKSGRRYRRCKTCACLNNDWCATCTAFPRPKRLAHLSDGVRKRRRCEGKAGYVDEGAQSVVSIRDPVHCSCECGQVKDALIVTESFASGNDAVFHSCGDTSGAAASPSEGFASFDDEEAHASGRICDDESISGESTAHFLWNTMDDMDADRRQSGDDAVHNLPAHSQAHDAREGVVVVGENSTYVDVFEDDEDGFGCQRAAATLGDNLLSDLGLVTMDQDGKRKRVPEFSLAVMDDPLPPGVSLVET